MLQPYAKAYLKVVKPIKFKSWEYINWITAKHTEFRELKGLRKRQPYSDREQLGCKIAIKALEKQIAKTPMQNYYNEGDYVWECVSCEEVVAEGQNYCHNCGQKLLELD